MKVKHYIIGVIIIIIDQLSKFMIIDKHIPIIPNFIEFNYTKNTSGGAFGIGRMNLILVLSIFIIVGIIIFLIKERKKITKHIPFTLILSGSIANLIDRLFRGYVVDFIDINIFNFPNFNIADISIFIGIMSLIYIIIIKYFKVSKN